MAIERTMRAPSEKGTRQGVVNGPIRANCIVEDLSHWVLFEHATGDVYAVGSRERDSYLIVPINKVQLIMQIISRLNQGVEPATIDAEIAVEYRKRVSASDLFRKLEAAHLTNSNTKKTTAYSETLRNAVPLFALRVDHIFDRMSWSAILFSPLALVAGVLTILAAYAWLVMQHMPLHTHHSQPGDLVMVVAGSLVIALLHEASHCIAGLHHGLKPRKLHAALYLGFIPFIFMSIPGIYTVRPSSRIVIWSAGLYANFALGGVFALLQIALPTASHWNSIVADLSAYNTALILINLSPFMATDGYFILSTLFKTPNARTRAFDKLKLFLAHGTRIESPFMICYIVGSMAMIALFALQMTREVIQGANELKLHGINTTSVEDLLPVLLFALASVVQLIKSRMNAKASMVSESSVPATADAIFPQTAERLT